ncbi:MAG: hypothetical protein IPL41_11940 [Micropruina sp.]|nr:hypothetical protein [Micropruina sp.]
MSHRWLVETRPSSVIPANAGISPTDDVLVATRPSSVIPAKAGISPTDDVPVETRPSSVIPANAGISPTDDVPVETRPSSVIFGECRDPPLVELVATWVAAALHGHVRFGAGEIPAFAGMTKGAAPLRDPSPG